MLLLIDNYDSFVYNLLQRFGEIDPTLDLRVRRNDQITLEEIAAWHPSRIVISPGPCTPNEAGISNGVIRAFANSIPILGVCLGHQCIGQVFGARIIRNRRVMHGKVSPIHHDGRGLFAGLANPFDATRYHSLVIEPGWEHPEFEVCAWTADGEIMGVRHKVWPLHGVQFHPESFLTIGGSKLLENFLRLA